jgi:hypothetical protein
LSLTGSSEVDGHGAERITEALTDFDAASGLDAALRSGHNVFQH